MKELVGQGKPFYSSLDKAAGLLRRKVGTGAEFLKELMSIPGVKQTEVAERGLGELLNAPKMTHEQFMAALGTKPAPAIQEKVFGGDREAQNEPAHHKNYTLPGGENYREMLIKAPKGVDNQEKIMELEAKLRRIPMFNSTPEQQAQIATYYNQLKDLKAQEAASPKPFPGVPHHFGGEPGILASLRLKDRTGPNGEKLLHLEELQSDWHQQGREKGYHDPEKLAQAEATINALKAEHKRLGEVKAQAKTPEEREAISEQRLAIMGQIRDATIMPFDHVPDAPFKKNWEEMALKRLIHHAAENGYHGIVITPGEEQADRYSLAKHVNEVHYSGSNLSAYDPQGYNVIKRTGVTPQELPSLIGKELAEKLMAQEPKGTLRSLSGLDLQVGGEGMKGFYDKKVPNILNSIGKKYGVKTELNGHNLKIREDLNFPEELSRRSNLPAHVPGETKPVHYFPITEEMRQDVKQNGIPLYESGGSVSTH